MSKTNKTKGRMPIIVFLMTLVLASVIFANTPSGPTILYNTSETPAPKPALLLNTTGGSFTTLLFNATSQNYRWKAYVGNVTGKLTLDDQSNMSIYDWNFASITGKVYASRNSTVDWNTITCANRTTVSTEDTSLNLLNEAVDSINRTFNNSIHKQFYSASRLIQNSTCPAIATYVNDTAQTINESARFQEILIEDGLKRLIYTTIIDGKLQGFDNNFYDFQMIVPNDETSPTPTPYYFYVELG